MKKYSFYILCVAALCGCGNKNVLLINQVPVTPAINPATKAIIKGNSLLYVRQDSGAIIHGITFNSAFRTADDFTDFELHPFSLQTATTPYSFNGNKCVYGSGQTLTPAVNFSADYGSTWTSFSPVFNPALPGAGFYSSGFFALSPVGDEEVLGLYVQQTYTNGNTRQLYKIDVPAKTATLVSSIQDNYIPLAMQFANAETGWLLLSNGGTFISSTTDSGVTWSKPVLIDTRNLGGLRVSAAGQVAVYSVPGAYFSADNGVTWKEAPASVYLADVSFVSSSLIYGLTDGGLEKSTDGGVSWSYVSNFNATFSNVTGIFFEDDQHGLAYGEQRLYETGDGGKSWKTLLYPYDYILQ
jgi:hypothetical protein